MILATRETSSGLSEVRPNHVGLIDPKTNEIDAEVPVGVRPGPLAVGGGAVWVGNLDERTLTKIDARRGVPAGTYPLGNRTPTGVAVGAGWVWVAHGALGQLSAVDPEFGQVSDPIEVAGEAIGSTNGAVAVGARAVWSVFADSTLRPRRPSHARGHRADADGQRARGVVVAEGYVWVVNSDSANVQRFDPATFQEGPIGTPISVGQRPTAIAAGAGAIWVANTGSDTVTRIDPGSAGSPPTTETIPVGDGPVALAVGAGSVSVANAGDGTVWRIDAAAQEVVKKIEVGNAPIRDRHRRGFGLGLGPVALSYELQTGEPRDRARVAAGRSDPLRHERRLARVRQREPPAQRRERGRRRAADTPSPSSLRSGPRPCAGGGRSPATAGSTSWCVR